MNINNSIENKNIREKKEKYIIISLKVLNEAIANVMKELKEYQNPKNIDTAQGYGYRDGTIDALNWVKNFKL